MTSPVAVETLLPSIEKFHRATRSKGQLRNAELEVERLTLSAEGAADRGLNNSDPIGGVVENLREFSVQVMRNLRRRPNS